MAETGTEIVASNSQQGLSPQQEAFVAARLQGKSDAESLALASYAPNALLRVLSDPMVQAALEAGVKALLASYAVDAALCVNGLVGTATSADRVKLDAARTALLTAGHVPPMREKPRARQSNLADMQSEDLRALVDQLTGELASRATPVSAPKRAPSSVEALDILA